MLVSLLAYSPFQRVSLTWGSGGADTVSSNPIFNVKTNIPQTVSSLQTFILAMLLFPEVQQRAQEEIDRVVGADRLPEYEDRDRLPYVMSVMMETLR